MLDWHKCQICYPLEIKLLLLLLYFRNTKAGGTGLGITRSQISSKWRIPFYVWGDNVKSYEQNDRSVPVPKVIFGASDSYAVNAVNCFVCKSIVSHDCPKWRSIRSSASIIILTAMTMVTQIYNQY